MLRANGNYTTSEYQGYAMAFAAAMGDEERYAKLFAFTKKYIDLNTKWHVMPWLVEGNRIGGPNSAMDGCIEIVYSMDLAESKWPGKGYGEAAKDYIQNLLNIGTEKSGWWWPDSNYILPARTPGKIGYHANYMAVAWLPRFTARSGDPRFAGPVTKAWWKLLEYSYENYALVGCCLLEDGRQSRVGDKGFCGVPGSGWNRYDSGPTRFGWRISMPYLLYGDPNSKKWADKLTAFWVEQGAEEDVKNVKAGYNFTDGHCYWPNDKPTNIAGAGANAMVSGNQKIADGAWEYLKNWKIPSKKLQDDGTTVWGMIIMSGMLVPAEYNPADYTTSVKPDHQHRSIQGRIRGSEEHTTRAYTISGRKVPVVSLEDVRSTGLCIVNIDGRGILMQPRISQ
jgi:hypothetical protein